ncbi:MAG: TRAP transporter substrate-binding protein [Gammaproteobacteria bacterium]|nr:TRAP transporter substrate-binding protein [Gammaproteobacteria bacterium]
MKRRQFVKHTAAGALLTGTLAACGRQQRQDAPAANATTETRHWKMVTAWPKNFPGLGVGAEHLARLITEMSGGRITVKVYGAGELVPAFEAFDAVRGGVAQMGHASAYYWQGKNPAFNFFSTVPFGMNAAEMNAWLYKGGGLELWREAYQPFGLVPMPVGNTGLQMGGWFNREINSIADLRGLKMRIPGLGGKVLERAGGVAVALPGGELFTAMQTGAIDATEWTNPYNDLAFGLHKAAKYYYYPGWHEPGTTLECFINRAAFEELPKDLRAIVLRAGESANQDMLADYTARNFGALKTLVDEHGVSVRRFPDDVLARFRELSAGVVAEVAAANPLAARIHESWRRFLDAVGDWNALSEKAYFDIRYN